MNDHELYQLCKKYGEMALSARRKFAGLLPEVFRRRLFEKKGYSSIFEFSAKLAGMTREQVSLVLNLERKFSDKPILKDALVSGEISANKLARVVSIATVENQDDLFGIVKSFSNRAVETFVRDVKRGRGGAGAEVGGDAGVDCGASVVVGDRVQNEFQNESQIAVFQNRNGLDKPFLDPKSLHVQTLELDEDVEEKLLEMQEKGIDINQFLRDALMKRKEEIEIKKEEIAKEQESKRTDDGFKHESVKENRNVSRYVPAVVRKILCEEYGTKCSYPGCGKQAKILHHTSRFALTRSHDPRYIAPLCAAHHEIAHKIDVKFVRKAILA